jgi:hypothetical protein
VRSSPATRSSATREAAFVLARGIAAMTAVRSRSGLLGHFWNCPSGSCCLPTASLSTRTLVRRSRVRSSRDGELLVLNSRIEDRVEDVGAVMFGLARRRPRRSP